MAFSIKLGNFQTQTSLTMKFSKRFKIKKFKFGDIVKAFENVFSTFSCNPDLMTFRVSVQNGELEGSKEVSLDDLYSIINLDENSQYISCSYSFDDTTIIEKEFESIMLLFLESSYHLCIEANKSEAIYKIHEIFVNQLALEEYIPEKQESVFEKLVRLENRLSLIEENIALNKRKLTCFISLRFDDKSKSYLQQLEKFLKLLNINVVTGLPYEPRKVSEKVISKLNKIDFVIYLIAAESESLWTRDELVLGSQKTCYAISLVEKGSKFTGEIFSDLEYIEFETDRIESAFIKLLEGINFIKENKNNID